MQNQKTARAEKTDELPLLSAKEVVLIEALGEGADNIEAYRRAYGAENYSVPALNVQACRKIAEPKIQAHLRALRAVGLTKTCLSLEERIKEERAFAQRAEDAGNYGAAGGAYDRVNKLLGLYVERMEVKHADPTAILRELASVSPALAQAYAQQNNLDWDKNDTPHAH